MCRYVLMAAVLAAAGNVQSAGAQGLSIGDPAPKLEVKEFVKGQPVKALEKGKTYVVEFWATWCGPCRSSIPHLTDLQKKHKDVVFIGVSVWESDPKDVKPFVEEMGDKMAYRVAVDDVPEGAKADKGKMAANWMTAAGQGGIPTAFIVNADGKVAWIGHPMEMDKPLNQIIEGTYDLKAAIAEHKAAQTRQQKIGKLRERLLAAQKANDPQAIVAVLDEAIADEPSLEKVIGVQKLNLMANTKDNQQATAEYGRRLLEKVLKDDAQGLNNLAWMLAASQAKRKADPELTKIALAAAQRADELTGGKNPHVTDTLAKVYFESGDVAKAIETQERALKLVEGTPLANDKGLKDRLEQYRKAAQK